MAIVTRLGSPTVASNGRQEGQVYKVFPMPVFAAVDLPACCPVIIAYNGTTKRFEASKAGGAGYNANGLALARVQGFTFRDAKAGEVVTLVQEAWFASYTATNITTVTPVYLSAVTAGELDDVAPFAGADPVGILYPSMSSSNTPLTPNGGAVLHVWETRK